MSAPQLDQERIRVAMDAARAARRAARILTTTAGKPLEGRTRVRLSEAHAELHAALARLAFLRRES